MYVCRFSGDTVTFGVVKLHRGGVGFMTAAVPADPSLSLSRSLDGVDIYSTRSARSYFFFKARSAFGKPPKILTSCGGHVYTWVTVRGACFRPFLRKRGPFCMYTLVRFFLSPAEIPIVRGVLEVVGRPTWRADKRRLDKCSDGCAPRCEVKVNERRVFPGFVCVVFFFLEVSGVEPEPRKRKWK